MDMNGAADYQETTEESLRGCREFVDGVLSLDDPLVQPAVTPRFIPTCSSDLMSGLAAIAEAHNLLIQSHISESNDEVRCEKGGVNIRERERERETYLDLLIRSDMSRTGKDVSAREETKYYHTSIVAMTWPLLTTLALAL
jgi:cytosine/adenosine deaminase-related metal-dependent hydrolase